MAIDRRDLLIGLAAAGALRTTAFADTAREPAFVTCCRLGDGSFAAAVLDGSLELLFAEQLDGRGHDVAVSPDRRLAVAFARRPGRFALVIDLDQRRRLLAFAPPEDRHFYGHGFFSPAGRLLYATENDFDGERGVLGVYDVGARFRRIGEIATHGIGPHEAMLMRDGHTVAVANGGLATHPDYPRLKLNLASMRPSLVYLDLETGDLLDTADVPQDWHQLSIRHLAEAADGSVWFGGQYEGLATDRVSLVGTHRPGGDIAFLSAPDEVYAGMNQYVGSVDASADGHRVATTSPRGGRLLVWDTETRALVETRDIADVCAAAPRGKGFLFSDGNGNLWPDSDEPLVDARVSWDNHIAALRRT